MNCLKKNKTGLCFVLLSILIFFIACEDFFITEVENPDVPGTEPQIVVNSYISPQDSLIIVYVKRSKPYMMNPADFITVAGNANVFIAEKNKEFKKLEYNSYYDAYVINANDFIVEPGKYYQLRVESAEGETVKAECYVPKFELKEIEIDSPLETTDEWGYDVLSIEWRIKTVNNNDENFYRSSAYLKQIIHLKDYDYHGQDTIIEYNSHLWLKRGQPYFTDSEGNTYRFIAESWDYRYYIPNDTTESDVKVSNEMYVYLLKTDYNYYSFHKSANNYFMYDDGFPFAESVHIFSNIEGGLGVFAGYNRRDYFVTSY